MHTKKGREEDYNVFGDVDLCCISTVQTNGAQKGSSQNGTCACKYNPLALTMGIKIFISPFNVTCIQTAFPPPLKH